jgi:putative FmdB family regulatory protein
VPIYEYECGGCKRRVSLLVRSFASAEAPRCPRCGSVELSRLMSRFSSPKSEEARLEAAADHRSFNRNGEAFDKGETFSGVPFELGLDVVERLRPLVPAGATLAQLALRWILMFDAVSCAIPGAKSPEQARANIAAAELEPLPPAALAAVARIYDEALRPLVHASW